VCRPELKREDFVTRIVAATAALLAFCVVAFPVIRAYESGDNMAHVAVLGMTDASREWLRVREAPYSFGYLYHDGYAAAVISAFAERDDRLLTPVYIGTPGYASAGNEYYGRLIQTFSGDFLTRAWAAVAAVLQMPFEEAYHLRPPWIPSALDGLFTAREKILETISFLPPIVAALAFWIGIALRSVWLAVFFVVFFVLVSGMTSIQFQGRHVFHLEVLPLLIYGALIHRLVAAVRQNPPLALPPRAFAVKLGLLVSVLIAAMVVPVAVARAYQEERVADLLSAYTAADVTPIERRGEPTGVDRVLFDARLAPSDSPPNFIDTNVIRLAVGGNECDIDTVALTFRYQTRPPFADFSRESLVPAPPPGSPPTLVVFPVYSLGLRSTLRDHFRFVGIEVASGMENCVVAFERFSRPNQFPLLLETVLLPDWRERPLYETLREYEPGPAEWIRTLYAAPANARPGRRWLTQLAPVTAAATFRSSQVERLEAGAIDARGRARTSSAYLVSWPYEHREKGSAFFIEGEIFDGGMTVGIQQNEQWVQQLNIPRPGRFRAVIRVEADGTYGAVLANYQLRSLYHRSTITRYGWLPPQQQ
jgi:hypothetical protein